jgi:thioredoxin reductase (NADPH)
MEQYDVIIIGGGPAGLSASIYASRFTLKNLVLVKVPYGLIAQSESLENWPGTPKTTGIQLMMNMEEQVKSHDVSEMKYESAVEIKKIKGGFSVKTENSEYKTKTIIYATGTERRKLGVKGEKEFAGKGVSYCATCDAPLFKNKIVAVVGGGDSAVKEAYLLAAHTKKVYLIYRGAKFRAESVNVEHLDALVKKGKVELVLKSNIKEIKGDKFVNEVLLDTGKTLKLDGVFVEIGGVPQSSMAKNIGVAVDDKEEVIVDIDGKTNVPGFFAAGDVTNRSFKQAITGAAEGVAAAFCVNNYLKGKK